MDGNADAVADAARALIGARFRPQGRDPVFGLDCIGLAAASFAAAGMRIDAPRDYPQQGGDPVRIGELIEAAGLDRIDPAAARAGDLLLLEAGPAQYHLAIRTAQGFVHADAGLRRVVETPGAPRWAVIGAWRARGGRG